MKPDRLFKTLAWRHPLQHREPAAGFASRLAALNGKRLGKFLREMQVHPRTLDKAEESAIRSLAVLGGVDRTELNRYTPKPLTEKFYSVAGEKLGRLSINRTYFRYCPHCVLNDLERYEGAAVARPWLRLQWTIGHFRSCDEHGVFYETAQPHRRPFEPFDFSETMSSLLKEMEAKSTMADRARPSPFQGWLHGRIDGLRDPENWLDDVPLYAAVEFCEALGLSALHEPKVKTTSLSLAEWAMAADEGFRIASGGEESLRTLLTRLNDAQVAARGVWGLRDTYGYAYGLLQKTVADPGYEKFRTAIRKFAIETMPIEPGTDVLGQVLAERKVHTVRTASRESGAHALTIRRFMERQGFVRSRDESGPMDHRVTVSAGEISKVVGQLKNALTTRQVAERTRIPRTHLNEMISAGYLPTVTDSRNRSNAKHRFALSDVDILMERLFLGAVDVHDPDPRQRTMQRARLAATATLSQLLDFVFGNKLAWKGRLVSAVGYEALLVDADEVTRLVRSGQTKTGLTKVEVMDFIPGMGRDSVQRFINCGYLVTVQEFNPEARRMTTVVSRESAESFKATYVSLGELSRQTGLHHKRVRLVLRLAEIEAAFNPDEFGCFFYKRAEVEHGQNSATDFWDYDQEIALMQARKLRNACQNSPTN